jgi:hypothetical protein
MLRRARAVVAFVSAMLFVAMAICFVRAQFAHDDFRVLRWNPATRNFTDVRISHRTAGLFIHAESTTASALDNTSVVLAMVGPSNMRFVHDVWPPSAGDSPFLWADHYRSTPTVGINQSGLSNCWTLEFRYELALIVFAVFPTLWGADLLRRLLRRRASARRGFAVVPDAMSEMG